MTVTMTAEARRTAVWATGPAHDEHGRPRSTMQDIVCETCRDHSLRAPAHTHKPIEQWATTHARHTGHRDYTRTTTTPLRVAPVAHVPEARTQ